MPARDLGHKHTIEGVDIYDTDPVAAEVLYSANASGHLGHTAELTAGVGVGLQFTEIADAAAPAANGVRLYARDNGAGKTQLVAVFSSGAVQVLATQP